jgi:cytochrome c551/c552
MKKVFLILLACAISLSAYAARANKYDNLSFQSPPKTNTSTGVAKIDAAIVSNQCDSCHSVVAKNMAPSWGAIADKYFDVKSVAVAGKPVQLRTFLIEKSINGGNGSFGTMPMPKYAEKSRQDIEIVVDYILKLKASASVLPPPPTGSVPPLPSPK